MQNVSCYNCGTSDAAPFAKENGYRLTKCTKCGLLYVNPRPSSEEIEQAHRLGQHRGAKPIETTGYYDFSKVSSYGRTLRDIFGDGAPFKARRGST